MALDASDMLDAAKTARELATFTALILIQSGGNSEAALALCAELEPIAPVDSIYILNCVTLSAQAIRDAMKMRKG